MDLAAPVSHRHQHHVALGHHEHRHLGKHLPVDRPIAARNPVVEAQPPADGVLETPVGSTRLASYRRPRLRLNACIGQPVAEPRRDRSDTMGCAVQSGPERLRRHLQRPHAGRRRTLIMKTPLTPLIGETPTPPQQSGKVGTGQSVVEQRFERVLLAGRRWVVLSRTLSSGRRDGSRSLDRASYRHRGVHRA